jgi:transcriptional regulator with XRE-family HTH domain
MAKKIQDKPYTKAIAKRFLQMMKDVIHEGQCIDKVDFATKIGEWSQNITAMEKGGRAPTLEQLATACKKFGYNPTWLVLGVGNKKLTQDDHKKRITELETEMVRIKKLMKKN